IRDGHVTGVQTCALPICDRWMGGGAVPAGTTHPIALAVLPFRNATGDAALASIGPSVADMIAADVGQSTVLRLVSADRVFQLLRDLRLGSDAEIDDSTARRIASFTSADTVVSGRFE